MKGPGFTCSSTPAVDAGDTFPCGGIVEGTCWGPVSWCKKTEQYCLITDFPCIDVGPSCTGAPANCNGLDQAAFNACVCGPDGINCVDAGTGWATEVQFQ